MLFSYVLLFLQVSLVLYKPFTEWRKIYHTHAASANSLYAFTFSVIWLPELKAYESEGQCSLNTYKLYGIQVYLYIGVLLSSPGKVETAAARYAADDDEENQTGESDQDHYHKGAY